MSEQPQENRQRERKGAKVPLILAMALLVLGAGIFFYPAISNFIADLSHREIITSHANMVNSLDEETLEEEWQKAIEYNENLMGDPVHDPFIPGSGYAIPDNYQDVLALDDVMCTLEIPRSPLCPLADSTATPFLPDTGDCPARNCSPGWTRWR